VTSKQRTLLVDAATVSCPLILVVAVRTLFTPAPSQASAPKASPAQPTPAVVPVAGPAKLTPEQQKALDWIAGLPPMTGLVSPLDHPIAPPPVVQQAAHEPDPEPAPATTPAVDPLAGLKLSGILGNETGGLAAINGRVYRVGDVVRPGLKLKLIDARTNTVTFSQDDGSELKLHRKQQ